MTSWSMIATASMPVFATGVDKRVKGDDGIRRDDVWTWKSTFMPPLSKPCLIALNAAVRQQRLPDDEPVLPSPRSVSDARSGCGIMPSTLPSALQIARDVLGRSVWVEVGKHAALGRAVAKDDLPLALHLLEHVRGDLVVALAVGDGDAKHLPLVRGRRPRACSWSRP